MLNIQVRLLWDKSTTEQGLLLTGVWTEEWFSIDKDEFLEKADIDENKLYAYTPNLCKFIDLELETFNVIENYLNEGGLPVGMPACTIMGLPAHVYFIDIQEEEE